MASFRGTFTALGLLRYIARGARVRSTGCTRQRRAGLPAAVRRSCVTLCAGGALCAVPFTQTDMLSHDALIRRASSLVTDSANTYLSQTTLALVDALTRYVKAMRTLLVLQQRYVDIAGKLNPTDEETSWQVILRQQREVKDRRDECKQFESNWRNAIDLSELAAEAAYNAGADQASVMARTNLQVAQAQVEEARQQSLEAERKLAEAGAESMQRVAMVAPQEEDTDVPEAYLRED